MSASYLKVFEHLNDCLTAQTQRGDETIANALIRERELMERITQSTLKERLGLFPENVDPDEWVESFIQATKRRLGCERHEAVGTIMAMVRGDVPEPDPGDES